MANIAKRKWRLEILKNLTREYQELNGQHIKTLSYPPTAIEFAQHIRVSRPVIIRGVELPAFRKWTDDYLISKMGETQITVAVTPTGRADAIAFGQDGKQYFTEPHDEKLTMRDLLSRLASRSGDSDSEVCYLQSQNGNLYNTPEQKGEFEALVQDVPQEISWASEALEASPDAVNIWIGNEQSVTSVHSDPYENIYVVIRGTKHFTLFPPTEGWCLQERMYPHARYARESPGTTLTLFPSSSTAPIRWSSIHNPMDSANLPSEACPLHVTLREGESLYLPAGWWHYVRQTGVTIALNWWYDIESRGMGWVWLSFLRGEDEEVPDGNESDLSLEV